MKQKLIIFVGIVLVGVILVALNAASYIQKPKVADTEIAPNRSTYHTGATGTHAFYSLLAESGRRVTRWQESAEALSTSRNRPSVFVIIRPQPRNFTDPEASAVLAWVSLGGRLVVIDRSPPDALAKTTAYWKVGYSPASGGNIRDADPSSASDMITGVTAAKPGQPTVFTSGVNAVQPSRFASDLIFERQSGMDSGRDRDDTVAEPGGGDAPVAHFVTGSKNIVVDVPYGEGRIVLLSDPYIVSNGGISLVDNAQMAINLVSSENGIVAFDEYHHGFGSNNNRVLEFFAGTPVAAIFLQCLALAGFVFYSRSRRFARPLPEAEPDRLSKLEYVSAMAELQQRTRAFDLAVENIYRDFRRRASRLLGVDNGLVSTADLAARIGERAHLEKGFVEEIMNGCEQIIFGEPTGKREVLALTAKIRELEQALGLTRRTGK